MKGNCACIRDGLLMELNKCIVSLHGERGSVGRVANYGGTGLRFRCIEPVVVLVKWWTTEAQVSGLVV